MKTSSIPNFRKLREEMVEKAIFARGVRSELVLNAMRSVPRESFLQTQLHEFAYDDAPLPIEEGQTISQPYIVAFMTEALALRGGEKVLEIGTGSGYAAAVLSEMAADVYTVERHGPLAEKAAATLADLGYDNVHVLHSDGTRGWAAHAPYDAIVVAAGGPTVPESLKDQLKIGGRLVIPVGADQRAQELVRVTRISQDEYRREDLADVRFVPLLGEEGWAPEEAEPARVRRAPQAIATSEDMLVKIVADAAEPFGLIDSAILARCSIGSATPASCCSAKQPMAPRNSIGCASAISRELIVKKGFRFIAIEGDWPDAARVDNYVRHIEISPSEWTAFSRFPTWMWRNNEVRDFVDWLRDQMPRPNPRGGRRSTASTSTACMRRSARCRIYLDQVEPDAAKVARQRYGCLTPWQRDPAAYGRAALSGPIQSASSRGARSQGSARKGVAYAKRDGERFFDAAQNARLVANAERYYRVMYYGSRASWNLRDEHMLTTLQNLLAFTAAAPRQSCGRTIPMSAMRRRPRWPSRGEHQYRAAVSPANSATMPT